jgi:predicted RNA-binding Zn ribbon-like protein
MVIAGNRTLPDLELPVNSITVATGRTPEELRLDGGHLALDFVNTVGGLRDDPPDPDDEALETYDDLVAWSRRVGLTPGGGRLNRAAEQRAVARAHELRALIYAIFRACADGREPRSRDLARLRDAEREALGHAELVPGGWRWPPSRDLESPLRPIAHAAVELLTHGPLDRIKTCGNCRWLFLDHSRNGSRRWCSMEGCGTEVKARRFVERRRERRATNT